MDSRSSTALSAPPTSESIRIGRPISAPAPDIADRKAALRTQARADRDALQAGLGAAAASGLVARFYREPELQALLAPDMILAGYAPIGSEIDCLPLLKRVAESGLQTCLPAVAEKDMPLLFRRWSPGERLRTGGWGISEPLPDAGEVTPDIVLVPMLAFDRAGHRLGYGGGYYDRTLAALRRTGEVTAIGVAFTGQVRETVPVTDGDECLDWIVTETSAWRTGPGGG